MSRPATDWQDRAACTGMPVHLFFPVGDQSRTAAQVARAKRVCERCDVVTECLTSAIETAEVDGIWGGRTPLERRALKRKRV